MQKATSSPALKAILFDFNGVIADDEPIHFQAFVKALKPEGITLTKKDYYETYIGMDDRGCFRELLTRNGRRPTEDEIAAFIRRKSKEYDTLITDHLVLFPGVKEFVKRAAHTYRLAIVSGGLRPEIAMALGWARLRSAFQVIITAEDVKEGKPHPEGYLKALTALEGTDRGPLAHIGPQNCLVIEDTIAGIEAAHAAGMKCLAVANTYPPDKLKIADAVTRSLKGYPLSRLERIVSRDSSLRSE